VTLLSQMGDMYATIQVSNMSLNIHFLIVCFKLINFTFLIFPLLVLGKSISFMRNSAQTKCIKLARMQLQLRFGPPPFTHKLRIFITS
jgi:hypothetical protein